MTVELSMFVVMVITMFKSFELICVFNYNYDIVVFLLSTLKFVVL